MNAFAALFSLELGRRRHYPLFGAALGLLALALPWFGSTDPSATRAIGAGIFAFVLLLGGALLAGSALFVDDLAAGRAGFLVARPIRSWQQLGGRVAALLVALAAAVILTVLPAILAGAEILGESGSLAVVFSTIAGPKEALLLPAAGVIRPAALVLAVLGLVGLGNALGLMTRVRGGWLLLDLASGIALSAGLLRAAEELAVQGSGALRYIVWPLALVLAGLGLSVATSVQVASGRTDGQRGHRAFSITWFAAAVALSIATIGFSRWYVSPSPYDLELESLTVIEHSPRFLEVHGTVPRPAPLEARFLVDRESGRTVRLEVLGWRGMPYTSRSTALVDEGRVAYWWKRDRRSRNQVLHRLDLAAPDSRPQETPVELESGWVAGPVSPDGTVVYRARVTDLRTIELVGERTDGAGAILSKRIETQGFRRFSWVDATERSVRILLLVEESSPWGRPEEGSELTLPEGCREDASSPLVDELAQKIRGVLIDVDSGAGEPGVRPLGVPVRTFGDDSGVIVGGPAGDRSILLRLGNQGWARVASGSGRITGCLVVPQEPEARLARGAPRFFPSGRILVRFSSGAECRWAIFDTIGRQLITAPNAGNGYGSGFVVEDGLQFLHAFPSFPFIPILEDLSLLADPDCPPTTGLEPGWYVRSLDISTEQLEQTGPLQPEEVLRHLFKRPLEGSM